MGRQLGVQVPALLATAVLGLLVFSENGRAQAPADQTGAQPADKRIAALQTQWKAGDTPARLRILNRLQRLRPRSEAATPLLMMALQDRDPKIRSQGAMAFYSIGTVDQVPAPALIAALKDSDRDVRHAVAWALSRAGQNAQPAIPDLVAILRAEKDGPCPSVFSALQSIGEPAVPALLQFINDPDPDRQKKALESIGVIGPAAKAALPVLLEQLNGPKSEIRRAVALALSRMGPNAIDPLIRALRDRDPRIRGTAARALADMGEKARPAIPALIDALSSMEPPLDPEPPPKPDFAGMGFSESRNEPPPQGFSRILKDLGAVAVPPLIERLKSPDRGARVVAMRTLGFFQDEARAAVPILMESLNDRDDRLEALEALGGIAHAARAAVPRLIEGLKDADPIFRAAAAEGLGRIGWASLNWTDSRYRYPSPARSAVDPLIAALKDPDPRVRKCSLIALCDIGDDSQRAIPDIVNLLKDSVPEVRLAAVRAFRRLGGVPASARETVAGLLKDTNRRTQLEVTSVLGTEAPTEPVVIATLLEALKDPNAEVRAEAAYKLALMNGKEGVCVDGQTIVGAHQQSHALANSSTAGAALRTALTDPDPRVRAAVAYALIVFKREASASVPLLIGRLKDPSVVVRLAAAVALGHFGSEARGAVPALLDALNDPEGSAFEDFRVSAKAAKALQAIRPDTRAKIVDRLLTQLGDPDQKVRESASGTLWDLVFSNGSDQKMVDYLFKALRNPASPQFLAKEALGLLSNSFDAAFGYSEDHDPPEGLGPEAKASVPALIRLARDDDWNVKKNAIQLLAVIERGNPVLTELILDAVRDDGLQSWYGQIVLESVWFSAIPVLIKRSNDADRDVRTLATHLLGKVVSGRLLGEQGEAEENPKPARPDPESLRLKSQAIDALNAALKDPDNPVRWSAAVALGRVGSIAKGAVPALIALAADRAGLIEPDSMIVLTSVWEDHPEGNGMVSVGLWPSRGEHRLCLAAIQALALIGAEAREAVPTLIAALRDGDPLVRLHAAGAIGRIGPDARAAVPDLLALLRSRDEAIVYPKHAVAPHNSKPVALAAAIAIGKVGPEARAAVPELIAILKRPDNASIHAAVLRTLGRVGPAAGAAVPVLIEMMINNNPPASSGLDGSQILGEIGPAAVPALLEVWRDRGHDTKVRQRAAEALAAIGPKAGEAIPALLEGLDDRDEEIRTAAAKALGQVGNGAEARVAIPGLIKALQDKDDLVRRDAAAALGTIGPKTDRVVPALIAAMKDPDQEVRSQSADALEAIGEPAIPALIALMRSGDADLRNDAARTLAYMGWDRSTDYAEQENGKDEPTRRRIRAARAAMIAAFNDPDKRLYDGACRAIETIGKRIVPELISALKSPNRLARLRTVQALEAFGTEAQAALEELARLRADQDPEIRNAAEAAIKAIKVSDP
jgi:HEAT repeat protein